jgi:hypothetical protein
MGMVNQTLRLVKLFMDHGVDIEKILSVYDDAEFSYKTSMNELKCKVNNYFF